MGTKVNSNYEDIINFVRASSTNNTGAMALRPVSYGSEQIINGDFVTGIADWTADPDGTISYSNGTLLYTGTSTGPTFMNVEQPDVFTVGKLYRISLDLVTSSDTANEIRLRSDTSAEIGNMTTTGSYEFIFLATGSDSSLRIGIVGGLAGESFSIDNVSAKEVLFDQPDGTLTLFPHPENVPRVEYDADGNRLGLLVEEQRINEFTYSEAFNESNWQRPNDSYAASTLPFTEQSPTKVANSAATLIDNNSGGTGGVYIRALATGLATSTPHTFSVFAKKDQLSYLALETKFFTVPTAIVYFDLDAGTVGTATNCTGAIQVYPDGWYRCSLTFTTDASDVSGYGNIFVAEGDGDKSVDRDGTSSIFIFGAQFEEGSFPTSYIKNEGTSGGVTRSADVAEIPVADFGYNQSVGTLLVDFDMKYTESGSTYPRAVEIASESSAADRIKIQLAESTGALVAQVYVNFNVQGSCGLGSRTGGSIDSTKVAFAFREADFAASDDGDTTVTDTTGTFAPSVGRDTLAIGKPASASSNFLNGHIKSIKYYPRRLTNAQLQALTEPRSTPTLSLTFDGQESSYKENYIHG